MIKCWEEKQKRKHNLNCYLAYGFKNVKKKQNKRVFGDTSFICLKEL